MFDFILKIWWMIAILPFLVFLEGNQMFSNFLKKKNIYSHWDVFHAFLAILILFLAILLAKGYR